MNHLPAEYDDGEFEPSVFDAASAIVDATSLRLQDPDLPWEDYERLGLMLGKMNRACSWWVGDLVIYGEEFFGHKVGQIEESLGLAPQTIANRASVARHVPPNARRPSLPFGVHAEVAYLEPAERDRWLDRAELGGWTRAKLRQEMGRGKELSSGLVGDLAVTGNHQDGSSSSELGEERPGNGVPAADGDFLGEPVPGPATCPACGHKLR